MGKHREPASRAALLKASQEKKKEGGLFLEGARMMARGLNPQVSEFLVREIVAYKVTRIFHAPMSWPDGAVDSWVRLPNSTAEYSATITGCLRQYLEIGSPLGQFADAPGLREAVEKVEKRSGSGSAYLVVEEQGPINGCRMERGECWPGPDAGREGIVIIKWCGGAWPEFSEQVDRDTLLLATVRTMTKREHPFELHARSLSYVTDQGEPAYPIVAEMSIAYGGPRAVSGFPNDAVKVWVAALGDRVERLRRASADPAVNELLNAIRLDQARDDEYFRLWYLRLWQALRDTGEFCTSQTLKSHLATLRPRQRWKDLTDHRNAIAHWETARVDYEKVADLHRFAMEVVDHIATITQIPSSNHP